MNPGTLERGTLGMVRSISDPLEHLVNQVEILRHQPHILRIEFFVNSLKNEKYVTKRKYLEERL